MKSIALAVLGVLLVVSTALVSYNVHAGDLGSTSCAHFLFESKVDAESGVKYRAWVKEYLALAKVGEGTDPLDWNMSVLVYCIHNKKETLLDATLVLVEQLKDGAYK